MEESDPIRVSCGSEDVCAPPKEGVESSDISETRLAMQE